MHNLSTDRPSPQSDLLTDRHVAAWRSLLRCGAHVLAVGGVDGKSKAPMSGRPSWKKNPLTLAEFDALISRRPARLLGFGIVPASVGAAVLDVDEVGDIDALRAAHPPAVEMGSLGGNLHLWYPAPDDEKIVNRKWEGYGCGGDFRSADGYIIPTEPWRLRKLEDGGTFPAHLAAAGKTKAKLAGYVVGNRRFALNADCYTAGMKGDEGAKREALEKALAAGLPAAQAHEAAGRAWAEGRAAATAPRDRIVLVPASKIKAEPIDWVLPDWLPTPGLTLLAGPPGIGKSTLAYLIAARVSTGGTILDDDDEPARSGSVVYQTSEEDWGTAVKPGLQVADADLDRVYRVPSTIERAEGGVQPLDLARDMDALARSIPADCRLIVIDPLVDIIVGAGKSGNMATEVREALRPIQQISQEKGIAVLGLHHVAKSQHTVGAGVRDRVVGSHAWVAVSRLCLFLDRDPEKKLQVVRAKSNVGEADGGASLRIEGRWMPADLIDGTAPIQAKLMVVLGRTTGDPDEIIQGKGYQAGRGGPGPAPTARTAAEAWLRTLFDDPEPVGWDEIKRRGGGDGHTPSALKNARDRLVGDGLIFTRKTSAGPWVWQAREGR